MKIPKHSLGFYLKEYRRHSAAVVLVFVGLGFLSGLVLSRAVWHKEGSPFMYTPTATSTQPVKKIPTLTPTLKGQTFFVNTELQAGRPVEIASKPVATWLGGWNTDVKTDVSKVMAKAAASATTPAFVLYNIPNRDCGSYSAGGLANATTYRTWVGAIASAIGSAPAAVIVEPDAVAGWDCLDNTSRTERIKMLREAIGLLAANPKTAIYLDAGHARWHSIDQIAKRLDTVGVGKIDGFSLNVSNFVKTDESIKYGNTLAERIGKRYIIDTSRNGQGPAPNNEWCNPWGRGLGKNPTTATGQKYVDAYLWVKAPGESDGTCNGGPTAGTYWPEYAAELIRNRVP